MKDKRKRKNRKERTVVTQVFEYGKKIIEIQNTEFDKAIDDLKIIEKKYK